MYAPENTDANLYTDNAIKGNEISYPVHVQFIDLHKMYMQRIRWHWHPAIEVLLAAKGKLVLVTDNKETCLEEGQGIFINQNVMHSVQPVDVEADCSLYSTMFDPAFLFGYGNTTITGKYLSPVLNSSSLKTLFLDSRDAVSGKLLDNIHSVISVNTDREYGYELITKSLLCQFWVHLLELLIPHTAPGGQPHSLSLDEIRVKDAILYIESHYSEQITLEQIASSVHISKSECCRCFKRVLQFTPIEYLMRYRILKAATMIQDNDPAYRNISDLAFNVGFNNVSYFNKVFKQYVKSTPSEYKKNLKNASGKSAENIMFI